MPQLDLRPLVDRFCAIIDRAQIAPGQWARWTAACPDQPHTVNPYGCADAINLLATFDALPRNDDPVRQAAIAGLQALQGDDGLFHESTHHPIHCTAHCVAALNLLGAEPLRPLSGLQEFMDPAAVAPFLDGLEWRDSPWNASHQGAGLYAALHLTHSVTPAWEDAYFQWLWDETDPETGFWRKGTQGPCTSHGNSIFPHLAGTFHYLFNHEHARRPLRFPERMIDTCLHIITKDPFPLGTGVSFADIDWVYCLNRAQRQSPHRWQEARQALSDFAQRYVAQLTARDALTDGRLNDLHALFGATCCLAELQASLPGQLRSDRPLHLVLDRRPFI